MAWWPWSKKKPKPRKLRALIERHLGIDLPEAQSVAHEIKPVQRVNLQQVIDRWAGQANPPAQLFGYSSAGYFGDDGLAKYLITDELIQAPVERAQLDSGPGETLDCVFRGLFLLRREAGPVVVAFRPPRFSSELPVLEVIAPTREAARGTLTALLNEAQQSSVYKGRTLSLDQSEAWRGGVSIRFHEVRPTSREDIVLPDELIRVVERNVLGMLQHAEALRSAGRSLRRGLLFHGPPGTGKTMVVRYLTRACPDHTVLLLTGSQQGQVREACQIARMLAPSIVVLEDVDLVAEDREHNRCPAVLHELLNEMDGLGSRDEVTFLLTTNRPEILEPALAARPGRIDQAIAFPLPDESCRRRLFEVYGRGLDLSVLDLERWVAQTNGVSPAFIEELLRKAALLAAERGESSRPLKLADGDVQDAIRELIYFGGELTQKLLGYRPGRIGYQPD
ncbi:MAG: AAA family ATPase [Gemmataceae bacterium]|nr:AAA family ATPase [Gemmataceae bacterium]